MALPERHESSARIHLVQNPVFCKLGLMTIDGCANRHVVNRCNKWLSTSTTIPLSVATKTTANISTLPTMSYKQCCRWCYKALGAFGVSRSILPTLSLSQSHLIHTRPFQNKHHFYTNKLIRQNMERDHATEPGQYTSKTSRRETGRSDRKDHGKEKRPRKPERNHASVTRVHTVDDRRIENGMPDRRPAKKPDRPRRGNPKVPVRTHTINDRRGDDEDASYYGRHDRDDDYRRNEHDGYYRKDRNDYSYANYDGPHDPNERKDLRKAAQEQRLRARHNPNRIATPIIFFYPQGYSTPYPAASYSQGFHPAQFAPPAGYPAASNPTHWQQYPSNLNGYRQPPMPQPPMPQRPIPAGPPLPDDPFDDRNWSHYSTWPWPAPPDRCRWDFMFEEIDQDQDGKTKFFKAVWARPPKTNNEKPEKAQIFVFCRKGIRVPLLCLTRLGKSTFIEDDGHCVME